MKTDGWMAQPGGVPHGPLRACVEAAAAAPSVHNSQPWRFRLRGGTIDVLADPTRELRVLDPTHRELMMSVGAAVFNLRIAMLARGRTPVTHLLPEADDPTVAARVTVGPPTTPSGTALALAAAIPRRHSNRRPFSEIAVPPATLVDLGTAARAEQARLVVVDPTARDAVLDLVRLAERRQRHNPAYLGELSAWTHHATGRRDGVPADAFGPRDLLETVPVRDFGVPGSLKRRPPVSFEHAPTVAVLYTPGDTPYHWLRGGQALERTLLTATARGLASTIMTQPTEIPDLRALLREPGDPYVAQAVVRFGYGPPSAASPRRPLEDVLLPADGSHS